MTTFSEQLTTFATRVGTECKTLHTKIGELTNLTTDDQTSVVNAVNEVKTAASTLQSTLNELSSRVTTVEGTANTSQGDLTLVQTQISSLQTTVGEIQTTLESISTGVEIDDETASDTTTYSSNKIESVVTTAKQAVKDDLLGGAGEAYDTLKELADLIESNETAIEALEALAAGHVKFDAAQELTDEQKTQARSNIGAADASTVSTLSSSLTSLEETVNTVKTDLDSLEDAIGSTETDFVSTFETALNSNESSE